MPISDYAHWNEEASLIWARENDFDSPDCDSSDEAIKQRVYDRMDDDDHPNDWED